MILACRDRQRAQTACDRIVEEAKNEQVFVEDLDLGDLSSVREFARRFREKHDRLDILINNAGIVNEQANEIEFHSCSALRCDDVSIRENQRWFRDSNWN